MTSLSELQLYSNNLNGTIPSSITSLRNLYTLYVSDNILSGSIPNTIGTMIELQSIILSNNFLTGTLPTSMLQLMQLAVVVLNNNIFSGSINNLFTNSIFILELQLSSNRFTGSIDHLVNTDINILCTVIDVSDNRLTGSIPNDIFSLPLSYFAAVKNCFTGSIPTTVCNRSNTLTTLVLDGLHTASTCQYKIFPGIPWIDSYTLSNAITGSIPDCLFRDMDVLHVLHLSGNGLKGSLPTDKLSSQLKSLSLSHNILTGTIPTSFQEYAWTELDLSFNRFTGQLSSNITDFASSNASLNLNLNRLSGSIPSVLVDVQDINILSGNMFACDVDGNDLPKHDSDRDSYVCGSESVNISLFSYVGVFVFVVIVLAVLYCSTSYDTRHNTIIASIMITNKVIPPEYTNIAKVFKHLSQVCRWIAWFTLLILSIFMLVYGILGMYYSSYSPKYAWQISIGYLSGKTPGVVMFVLMSLSLMVMMRMLMLHKQYAMNGRRRKRSDIQDTDDSIILTADSEVSIQRVMWMRCWLCGSILMNIVIVLVINGYYVYLVISDISKTRQFLLAIAMTLFKVTWRALLMRYFFSAFKQLELYYGSETIKQVIIWLCVFNNIVAPCLASLFVNVNCFYYTIVPSSDVSTTSCYTFCNEYDDGITCISETQYCVHTEYQPPFSYNYLCSSSLLETYADVWIYMFLLSGVMLPFISIVLMMLVESIDWNQYSDTFKQYVKRILAYKWYPIEWLRDEIVDADNEATNKQVDLIARSLFNNIPTITITTHTLLLQPASSPIISNRNILQVNAANIIPILKKCTKSMFSHLSFTAANNVCFHLQSLLLF